MKKKSIVYLVVIVLVIFAILLLTFMNNANSSKNNKESLQKLKVNEVTRSVFYAPQYVAINKEFFKKSGIDIELMTGQGADSVMTSVLSNQCDIGFAGPEASIYVYNEGKEDYTEVFAQMTKKDGSFLVARNKTDNFDWKALKGKTVIPGRKGGVPYMTLEYVLKQKGIDPRTDLILDDSIKFDLMAGAFSSGNADYVTLFEPTASTTEASGKGFVVASVGEAAGEIPYTAYFAKKSYIENNEETIQNFTDAIYKGQVWVKEHTAKEIAEAIQSFFPDTDIESLTTVIQNYKNIDAWNETPVLKQEAFDRLQEVMSMAGELDKKVPYDKIINNTFAEKSINK